MEKLYTRNSNTCEKLACRLDRNEEEKNKRPMSKENVRPRKRKKREERQGKRREKNKQWLGYEVKLLGLTMVVKKVMRTKKQLKVRVQIAKRAIVIAAVTARSKVVGGIQAWFT